MEHTLRVHRDGRSVKYKLESGTNLFKFLTQNSLGLEGVCNGNKTCGKCRVKVSGQLKEPNENEKELLGNELIEKSYRLACYINIDADLDVFLKDSGALNAKIVTEGKQISVKVNPLAAKRLIAVDTPSIDDQRSDLERLETIGRNVDFDLEIIRELAGILRQNDFKLTVVSFNDRVVSVESGDTSDRIYGIAVDIGTTTVAGYLVDLITGNRVDVYSMLNPQKIFGADVISRISYTMDSEDAFKQMNKAIIDDCINVIIEHFTNKNHISTDDIYAAAFVGNTTMMHFLMKIPARNIAVSPFIPVTTKMHELRASQLGIKINRYGIGVVFPSVSAYIGADTVAAVLASGMNEEDSITLLVDIGTNGEIVLGNSKWMYSCSAAAGPAFEGSNIRNGVAGITGAIDKVRFSPAFEYTTINDEKPIGICGSGIVDIISEMLASKIIDETGRIMDTEEMDDPIADELESRLVEIDGLKSFLIAGSMECGCETDIAVTQKDVRELQNAKAAIAAGINILIKQSGIKTEDIHKVLLAGGFGSYIDIESALNIGLLPKELRGRVESIGNAAGIGAVEGLISKGMLKKAEVIKAKIKYIELSTCADFMDEYVENMMFI